MKGPWKPAGKLPDAFAKLPADDNWKDVKAALPGSAAASMPKVFVSTTPAELILLRGAPNYLAGERHRSCCGSPTPTATSSGSARTARCTSSSRAAGSPPPGFDGPWTFATPNLPDDFKKIPLSHERSRVLASVPGTDEAAEAVLLAQIPQTARVDKKQVKAPEVQYQGDPQFEPIPQTTVARAANTDKDIIKVGDLYYMCFQGVWFMGRSPNGPWEVTGSVPGQIYEIPISSPSYNVTNVTVVEDNSDAVVFATAAAYTGLMIGWGCAVWGTGYYYPPYVGYGGYYPYYSPVLPDLRLPRLVQPVDRHLQPRRRPRTVRTAAPASAPRYNPRTGTYARGAAAYGPGGSRAVAGAYNPRTGASAATQTGLQRLRQLGTDRRAARRSVGQHVARHQQPHRHDDARDAGQRRRRRGHPEPGRRRRRRRRAHRQRRRLRRPRRQRLQEVG